MSTAQLAQGFEHPKDPLKGSDGAGQAGILGNGPIWEICVTVQK
jgi:hypothetical protein